MKYITKIKIIKITRIYINFFENGYNRRVKVKLKRQYINPYANLLKK